MAQRKDTGTTQTIRRPRQATDPPSSDTGNETPDGHRACHPASKIRVALNSLAWGHQGDMRSRFARMRARRAPRLLAQRAPARGVAAHRVGRPASRDRRSFWLSNVSADYDHRSRSPGKGPLAHRARLPRAQGRDRDRSLRGPWLARLSPPRCPMYRRLRHPGSRASSAFPPGASGLPQSTSSTPTFPPTGKSPYDLSVTTLIRYPLFDGSSRDCSLATSAAVSLAEGPVVTNTQ